MNKVEVFEKLDKLDLDKNNYIIISGASLVVQDIIDDTSDVDLSCSKEYYNSIEWPTKTGYFNTEIKYKDCFEIGCNFFDEDKIIIINGYKFMNLEACLDLKILENKKEDKKLIKKLDLELCLKDNYRYERKLRENKITLIGGVDEVGRGPLVGPVVAACVILPEEGKFSLDGLTDSKKLSEKKRDELFIKIKEEALAIGIGIIDEKKIDEVNIYEATKLAMKEAINNCPIKPEHILIDAMPLDIDIPTTSIIKGDIKSITISAASVIAKVTRDKMLYELDKQYPMYDFKDNKGYPTKKHLEAIEKYGIIKEHRRSYGPVKKYLEEVK
jgi:ribonuclease HII